MFGKALGIPIFLLLFFGSPAAQAATIFFDDFANNQLRPEWDIRNQDASSFWFSDGNLVVKTLPGDLNTNDYQNLFIIRNPVNNCDLQVTIKVTSFQPNAVYQQINIVAYDNDNNSIRCGNVQGKGRVWQLGTKINGAWTAQNNGSNASQSFFYVRLVKKGNLYQQYYSLDGKIFSPANGPVAYGDGTPEFLGLIAFESYGVTATPVTVSIDYFSVEKIGDSTAILPLLLLRP